MKQIFKASLIMLACFSLSAVAQDWYHDRDARFHGEEWRGHIFEHVRTDLDHVGSAIWAGGKEQHRLQAMKRELTDLQVKLQNGRYDEHELNDLIDAMVKSANDTRLAPRDHDVIADDLNRLRDYREHHDHWGR